jgi:hypothetical protein
VTVSVKRARFLAQKDISYHNSHAGDSKIGDTVPEKSLKGRSVSNRVILKDDGLCEPLNYVSIDFPYGEKSIAKFRFKYRSHSAFSPRCVVNKLAILYHADQTIGDLQIEGIIPRSPSPTPLKDLDLDGMTREEAIGELRRRRALESSPPRVKRERAATIAIDICDNDDDDGNNDEDVTITSMAPVNKRQRTSNAADIDTIDLTDD